MDASRTSRALRRVAIALLTTLIAATGLVGTSVATSSAAVASPYIFAPPSTVVGGASGTVNLPVTLSDAGTSTVMVDYSVPGGNCSWPNQATSGTLTFTPGQVTKNVTVTVNDCNVKATSFFVLTLSNPINSVIAQATTQVDVVGSPAPLGTTPGLYAKDAVVDASAGTVQVPVLLGGPAGATSASVVTVHYATANGTAVAGTDYTNTSGDLTFAAGQTVANVTVPIVKRTDAAGTRRFSVVLTTPVNATIVNGAGVVAVTSGGPTTVPTPYVSAPPNSVAGAFDGWMDLPVTLNSPSTNPVTVSYSVPGGNCTWATQAATGTLTFLPGVVQRTVRVQVNSCQIATKLVFTLTLSLPINAVIAQTDTQVDVAGNPSPLGTQPGLYVKDMTVDSSAGAVQVPVLLGGPNGATSASVVKVHFATQNGTAVAGTDFNATSGDLTFGPGQTALTVTVPLVRRSGQEGGLRRFSVVLTAPVNATIVNGTSVVSTLGGGLPVGGPFISAPPHTVVGAADGWIDLPVTLSIPTTLVVTVHYAVVGGNCSWPAQAANGTLTFPSLTRVKTIRVQINSCQTSVKSSFELTLSGALTGGFIDRATTQVNVVGNPNPTGALPGLSVKDSVVDAYAGFAQVPVLLGGPAGATSGSVVKVHYATANGTAIAGTDYTATSGDLTFGPGQTAATITVPLLSPPASAGVRKFAVWLSAPSNASIAAGTGLVTLGATGADFVQLPTISAPPDQVVAEDDGWVDLPVTLSGPSSNGLVTVNYSVPGGNCSWRSQATSGTLTFSNYTQIVRVQINKCGLAAGSFTLTLSGAANATIGKATTVVSLAPATYTTSYTAAEMPRVQQSANFYGVTPGALAKVGVQVLLYITNVSQPHQPPTRTTPPAPAGTSSFPTTWSADELVWFRQMQAQYFMTPEQTQKWGVQVVDFLLLQSGH